MGYRYTADAEGFTVRAPRGRTWAWLGAALTCVCYAYAAALPEVRALVALAALGGFGAACRSAFFAVTLRVRSGRLYCLPSGPTWQPAWSVTLAEVEGFEADATAGGAPITMVLLGGARLALPLPRPPGALRRLLGLDRVETPQVEVMELLDRLRELHASGS